MFVALYIYICVCVCVCVCVYVTRNFLAGEVLDKLCDMKCRAVEDIHFIFETCYGFFNTQ